MDTALRSWAGGAVQGGQRETGEGIGSDAVGGLRCNPVPDAAGARHGIRSSKPRSSGIDDEARPEGKAGGSTRRRTCAYFHACRSDRDRASILAGLKKMELKRLHVGKTL